MENLEIHGIFKLIFQTWKVIDFSIWSWKMLVLVMENE